MEAADEAKAELYGADILVIRELDFIRELGTFRVDAPTLQGRLAALERFGALFMGSLAV